MLEAAGKLWLAGSGVSWQGLKWGEASTASASARLIHLSGETLDRG